MKSFHRKSSVLLILTILILSAVELHPRSSEEMGQTKEELDNIRMELEAKREQLESLTKNEKSALKNIRAIEENIDLTGAFIRKLDNTSSLLQAEIDGLTRDLQFASSDVESLQEAFYARLEAIYKRERGRPLPAYLAAGSLSEAIRKHHLSKAMVEYDNQLITVMKSLIDDIDSKRELLMTNKQELARLKKERDRERWRLSRAKKQRQQFLSRVRMEKQLRLEAISLLEEEAAELEQILQDLALQDKTDAQLQPDYQTEFYRFKKRLPWPVKGKIVAAYGDIIHPTYKTRTFNPGIDIAAEYGEDVEAAADGRIAHIDYLRGYGNFVVIDHGEGYYSLYARLSEIMVNMNELVLKGQTIAKVGDAGAGDNPSLHFELRRGKSQYNPLDWLE